jgi:hypothetical protein
MIILKRINITLYKYQYLHTAEYSGNQGISDISVSVHHKFVIVWKALCS